LILKYYRPAEVDLLVGDATKAKTKAMGWTPTYTVAELIKKWLHLMLKYLNEINIC
jgi:GDPmannose 4,6-dehydratase